MGHIYKNIRETIGRTPLMKLNRLSEETGNRIFIKLEMFNPMSSIKDRPALKMIEDAEKAGKINSNTVLIEATSGNTGIALASICASKRLKLKIVMPESMSLERRAVLKALGAELILTEAGKGMKGAIEEMEKIAEQEKNCFVPSQFSNPSNPRSHFETTGPEIWDDTDGEVDVFIAGVGTGGTISGTSEYLKSRNPFLYAVAVEPCRSPVLSGKEAGPHRIQGIGAGFIPENLNRKIIDEVMCISDDDAKKTARDLASNEGLLAGISSGANCFAAYQLAMRFKHQNKSIVTIACDTGERYLSSWLFED